MSDAREEEMRRSNLNETIRRFNAAYPVGTPVVAYPGVRPEDGPDERIDTVTRTKAWLGCGTPVVMVEGHGAWIALTHIDPQPTSEEVTA